MKFRSAPRILLFAIFFPLAVLSQHFSDQNNEGQLRKIFSDFENTFAALNYGVAGLYSDASGRTEKAAVGWAAPGVKMTSDKVFNVGSLTKMFTAVLVLQETEKGRLQLSDTLGKFFSAGDNPPANLDLSITIEQLLLHRSGLGEVIVDTIANACFRDPFYSFNNPCQVNNISSSTFRKGEKYEYCNTNYLLLGNILELLNDKPYDELLKERIFQPCGMNHSYSYFSRSIPEAAHPMFDSLDLFDMVNFRFFRYYNFSAGGISSTVDDLHRFFRALYSNNTLLSRKAFAAMTRFHDNKGMGIELFPVKVNRTKSVQLIGHQGDNLSFKCRNYYNPATGELIVFLANCYGEKQVPKITNALMLQLWSEKK